MDDPEAIPSLTEAIVREQVSELRENMEDVLDQLIETKANTDIATKQL